MKNNADNILFRIYGSFGGGDDAVKSFLPSLRLLRHCIEPIRKERYLVEIERLEIWVYIGGDIVDYERTGADRLATGRKPPRVMVDYKVRRLDYVGKSQEECRALLSSGVNCCFESLWMRADGKGALRNQDELRAEFCVAMTEFGAKPIPPYVPLGTLQSLW